MPEHPPLEALEPGDHLPTLAEEHRRFLRFLTPRVRTPQDAEDILQTAFAKAASHERAPASETSVAWFYATLRNALTDYYRRLDVEKRALDRLQGDLQRERDAVWEEQLEQTVCECVKQLIPTLKPEYAELIQRVDLQEVSLPAAAAELGITANNAAVRLHRARVALRGRLEEACRTCATHGCLDCTCKK